MAIKVKYEHEPSYGHGRPQTVARVEIGVLGISGHGDTAEAARQDLLHRVKMHQAAVESTIRAIEQSTAPKVEPPRG
ncbi:MAG: hypothetical protein INR68_18520 [Methylobacterium mesophilicum]|nr:hypothetical protein [Methylobacterium mesophilicum]